MSELAHEPERKTPPKIRLSCDGCGHNVETSLDNTRNYMYVKQPWFNNLQVKCLDRECEETTPLFHDQIPDEAKAIAVQYPTSIYDFLDDADAQEPGEYSFVAARRRQVLGITEVESNDLSERQSKNVEHWGEFLQKVVIDVSDFGG